MNDTGLPSTMYH